MTTQPETIGNILDSLGQPSENKIREDANQLAIGRKLYEAKEKLREVEVALRVACRELTGDQASQVAAIERLAKSMREDF